MEASTDNLLREGNESTISKPNFKIHHGLMRKSTMIDFTQQRRRFTKKEIAQNKTVYWQYNSALVDVIEDSQCEEDFNDRSMNTTEIRGSTLSLHQGKISQYHEGKEYSNEFGEHGMSPVQKSNLHKAIHTCEPTVLPRMAIVLPKPRLGRSELIDLTDYILPKKQYFPSFHMQMKGPSENENLCPEQVECKELMPDQFQKLLDIVESLQSFESVPQLPTRSIKPKDKAYGIFQILPFVILTMFLFYFIWTSSLPGEILVTFSGMYMLLTSYIYSLVN